MNAITNDARITPHSSGRRLVVWLMGLMWLTFACSAALSATCTGKNKLPVLVETGRNEKFPEAQAEEIFARFIERLDDQNPSVAWSDTQTMRRLSGDMMVLQASDADRVADLDRFTEFALAEPLVTLKLGRLGDRYLVVVSLFNRRTGSAPYGDSNQLAADDDAGLLAQVLTHAERIAALVCSAQAPRSTPAVPSLQLELVNGETFERCIPGKPCEVVVAVTRVTDLNDGTPVAGKSVVLDHISPSGVSTTLEAQVTSVLGIASHGVTVGPELGRGRLQARLVLGPDRLVEPSNEASYIVIDPNASMRASTGKVMVTPRSNQTLCATLRKNGSPVVGKAIGFGATDGSLLADVAATGVNGEACVPYQAPARNVLVDLVSSTAPSPVEPLQQAFTSVVVDAGVVFNASGPVSIMIGGAATMSFDLTQNGQPLAGVPVNFRLDGPGLLSGNVAQTDAAGRADLVYLALPTTGAATITATASVDGQSYERAFTVGVTAPPAGKMIAELDAVYSWVTFGASPSPRQVMGCLYGVIDNDAVFEFAPPAACPFPGPNRQPPVSFQAVEATEGGKIRLSSGANQVVWAYDMIGIGGESYGVSVVWLEFTSNGSLMIEPTNHPVYDRSICATSRAFRTLAWPPGAGYALADEVSYGVPVPVSAGSRVGFWVIGSEEWFPRRAECPLSAEVRFTFRPAP